MNVNNIYYLHEIGAKRNQEDYIWPPPDTATAANKIFIVCDGVGGAENGELASKMIAEAVGKTVSNIDFTLLTNELINEILIDARNQLSLYVTQNGLNPDMATTFTLLVIDDAKAFIAWCGDSRVYHIRKGHILYKTSDHSLVNTLVKSGEITEKEAAVHPQKNIILKAIRADNSPIEAETYTIEDVKDGDFFMLCTDGLLENITEVEIMSLLSNHHNEDLSKSFHQYCENKTRDNYSMYLLKAGEQVQAPQTKKKRLLVTGILAIALLGSLAYLYFYLDSKKNISVPVTAPVTLVKDTVQNSPDTTNTPEGVVYYEIDESTGKNDTAKINKPQKEAAAIAKDSVAKYQKITKAQDSAQAGAIKIVIIPAKDTSQKLITNK